MGQWSDTYMKILVRVDPGGLEQVTSHPPPLHFELAHKKKISKLLIYFGDQTMNSLSDS